MTETIHPNNNELPDGNVGSINYIMRTMKANVNIGEVLFNNVEVTSVGTYTISFDVPDIDSNTMNKLYKNGTSATKMRDCWHVCASKTTITDIYFFENQNINEL